MAIHEMPREASAEILDILQSLRGVWPHCKTLYHPRDRKKRGIQGNVERYIMAVQWLADRGLMSFEAMTVDTTGLSILHSALTQRGREYSSACAPAEISQRPGN